MEAARMKRGDVPREGTCRLVPAGASVPPAVPRGESVISSQSRRAPVASSTVYRADAAWTAALRHLCRKRAVILGYHGVADCPRKDDEFMLQVPPAKFRAQLEMMLLAGYRFVTVAELARRAAGRRPPPGLAAVSFDDGMRNVVTAALPILADLGIRATVYVPTDWLGGSSPWIGAGGDGGILTYDELQKLVAAGWELGTHTLAHADLSKLDYDGCRRQIEGSCGALEPIAGRVQTLAYPFGRYNAAAIAAARDAGLLAAVATCSGSWEPYELTRAMIGSADPFPVVLLKLTDRCETMLRSPPLRLARRATEYLRERRLRRGRRNATP
jgi:peptidoglycan/xylan/chitin deacetylase (PgdA/CDA1 family)